MLSPREGVEKGCLASARGTHDGKELSWPGHPADPVQDGLVGEFRFEDLSRLDFDGVSHTAPLQGEPLVGRVLHLDGEVGGWTLGG